MINNYNPQNSPPNQDRNNFFPNTYRPPSPYYLNQEMNNGYYSQYSNIPIDRMTPSPLSLQTAKMNNMKTNKSVKTGISKTLSILFLPSNFFLRCRYKW